MCAFRASGPFHKPREEVKKNAAPNIIILPQKSIHG